MRSSISHIDQIPVAGSLKDAAYVRFLEFEMWRGVHALYIFSTPARTPSPSCTPTSRRSRSTSLTPMRKRKGKGKYKGKRKSSVGRVQVPRICSSGLSSLLASGTESRSSLRLTLGEAVKRLWSYAAAHGLKDGRNLRCNAAMRQLFGVPVLTMFEVSGALSSHMKGAGSGASNSSGSSSTAATTSRQSRLNQGGSTSSNPSSSRDAQLITLSPALTALVCGGSLDGRSSGGPRQLTLALSEALRLIGKYITRQGLRDGTDKRKIHCDAALAELVGKSMFTVFEAKALLSHHWTEVNATPGARGVSGDTDRRDVDSGSGAAAGGSQSQRRGANEDGDVDEEEGEEEEDEGGDSEDADSGSASDEDGNESEGDDGLEVELEPAETSASPNAADHWQCQRCTLVNESSRVSCDACMAPRTEAEPHESMVAGARASTALVADTSARDAAPQRSKGAGQGSTGAHRKRKAMPTPAEYLCPITQEVMHDPVSTADGHTYERTAIERWLSRGKRTSPLTGAVLTSAAVIPNHALRKLIEEHVAGSR